jgi:hypothetical protein
VVSFGYHETNRPAADAIDDNGSPRPEFLEERRAVEMEAMSEWLPLLGDRTTTAWIVTVVNKADLWWHYSDDVLKHYVSGTYATAVRSEDRRLKHVVLPYCAVVHRFYDGGLISPVYDDDMRMSHSATLLDTLATLE